MDVRFEDHAQLHRAALRASLGAATLAALAPSWALVPAAALGAVAALPLQRRPGRLLAGAVLVLAVAALAVPAAAWPLPAAGALLALGLAVQRLDAARESGARVSRAAIAVAVVLTAAALAAAWLWLPSMSAALAQLTGPVPAAIAAAALLGLWIAAASAPLHISLQADPVEARLAMLRPTLGAELRQLAEKAVAARTAAANALPSGSRGDLRGLLDALALAALDLARRAAELGRAASPVVEDELAKRVASLEESAVKAADAAARKSYLRASGTMGGQLDHCRRVRRTRERLVARLHEEVAQLDRARFALTLLEGADAECSALELDLLGERLQHSALACEAGTDPEPAPAAALSAGSQRSSGINA